jgi:rhodanese-related sulfurtransferase
VSVPEVEADEAHSLSAAGALLLVVREPEEWEAGRAPGARWVRLGELAGRVEELPRDQRIVAVCRSGARSGRATEFLGAQGFDVVNLAGGMKAWAAAGHPVVAEDGGPGAIV